MAGVGLPLTLLLFLILLPAVRPKRCPRRKPSSRCTYNCNTRTGLWIERSCRAPTVTVGIFEAPLDGLRACTARKPGKSTGGCGLTCDRKLGQWREEKICTTEASCTPNSDGTEVCFNNVRLVPPSGSGCDDSSGFDRCFVCDDSGVTHENNR